MLQYDHWNMANNVSALYASVLSLVPGEYFLFMCIYICGGVKRNLGYTSFVGVA